MSKFGGVCDMLPHYCEWIVLIFTSEVDTINLRSSDGKISVKTGKKLKFHKFHKISKNQICKVYCTPNIFYLS